MPKRSPIVPRIPVDLSSIERPPLGTIKWYRDHLVIPLRLRASSRGFTWIYFGRIAGKPCRKPLGKHPRMSLEAARASAGRLSSDGAGPAVAGAGASFASVRSMYFTSAEFAGLSPRTQRSYKWVLESDNYVGFEGRRIGQITRGDVLSLKDAIVASGKTYQNVLRPLQALMSWAVDRQLLEVSPASRLKLPSNRADPHPFTDTEAGMLLHAIDEEVSPVREVYLLIALTGARPSFWCDARWSEIDLRAATVQVSQARARTSKLGRSWTLPLSRQALAVLKELYASRTGPYITGGDRPFTLEQKVRDRIAERALLGLEGARGTPGRWRSTMLSWLDDKGVGAEVALRLAGHSTGTALAGSRHHYLGGKPTPDMKKWCQQWGDHLDMVRLL